MKALYFAWVREQIGLAEETIAPPPHVKTIADLVAWLKARGENYEAAFGNGRQIRAALDRVHVKPDAAIGPAKEVAFFPPMTGG
jgi:molybdopterin synthase sulfur carrier subunit